MGRNKVSFEEIKRLALKAGEEHWSDYIAAGQCPILDECINVGRAWMFFRNPEISLPEEASLRKCVLVISDNGDVRFTADYYPNFNESREYLKRMSEHFENIS